MLNTSPDAELESRQDARQRGCEPLEPRRLLSATLEDGELVVIATAGADDIDFSARGSDILVEVNGDAETFSVNDVDSIELRAGPGDDSIDLHDLGIGVLVQAQAGDDTVIGGNGDDSIAGAGGEDLLKGGAGDDLISGCANDDTIYGNGGEDNLIGNQGLDVLYGNGGDDFIRARRGSDTVFGGKGDDQLHGGWADDNVKGNPGDDDLTGGPDTDVLQQSPGSKPVVRADASEPWWLGGECRSRS